MSDMIFRRWAIPIPALLLGVIAHSQPAPAPMPALTVNDARTLTVNQLARALLGERLGSRVIEAVRHEYEASASVPRAVDLYTQPELPWPRINGICRTDVVTIEYNWFDLDGAAPSTPIQIAHVEATSRYKAFQMPPGEPGSPENERAQLAACADFSSALDAFRAPSAGDAQWLAAMAREYSRAAPRRGFDFTCSDFASATCAGAAQVLPQLALHLASEVERRDCPLRQSRDQVNYCYRLTFPYPGTEHAEWVLTMIGGMRDGMAPVEIRSLTLEHIRQPLSLH